MKNVVYLSSSEMQFFNELQKEPYGVPFSSAHTMILPANGTEKNSKIISELIHKGCLRIDFRENMKYLLCVKNKLEVTKEFNSKDYGYEVIGLPHSPVGMATLKKEFLENDKVLYLALGTTSYEVFEDFLKLRMNKGFQTIFIYPDYKSINSDKKRHYKTEKQRWERFYKQLPSYYKKLLLFRIAYKDFSYIKNSMFTSNNARVNMRMESTNVTSRKGVIVKCLKGNTLYKIVKYSYEDLYNNSYYNIKMHFFLFVSEVFKKHIIRIILITCCLAVLFFPIASNQIIMAFLSGIFVNIFMDWIRGAKWKKTL